MCSKRGQLAVGVCAILLLAVLPAWVAAAESTFTYQGQLKQGAAPVAGTCDFQFKLWNAVTNGQQQGSTVTVPAVAVQSGLFDVRLDFGVSVFNGEARWLDIAVRCPAGGGPYTPLTPREPITAAPYSVHTRGVYVDDAGRAGIGTLAPEAKLHVHTSGQTSVRGTGNWVGVFGLHDGSGTFPGVWGETTSTSNGASGIRGFATAASGSTYGLFGKSSSINGTGVYATNDADGSALLAVGNGAGRDRATLRVQNTQPTQGMAAYVKSQGTWATMHVENDSTGEVLWLQRDNSDGPFIVAYNADTGARPFSVSQHGYTKVAVLEIMGGADLSEGFDVASIEKSSKEGTEEASLTPRPGMVVSIDPDRPGKLVIASRPYDPTVAGIISGAGGVEPGMRMAHSGTAADGEHPVALSGRVYCLCDASIGAIRPGDLLTTSSRPGHAMKVLDRSRAGGAVIGKAMTALEEGTGLVLVLVSLQ